MSPDSKRRGAVLTSRATHNLEAKFLQAAAASHLKEVLACIDAGVDVNTYVGGPVNALHIAAERGDLPLGITLAQSPDLDYNLQTEEGYTPLILAIMIRKRKFVWFLLRKNADPNLKDHFGRSPFHHVSRLDAIELAFDLLKYGADVNAEDAFGNTPLMISLLCLNSLHMAKLLVKKGADIDPETQRSLPLFLEYVLICTTEEQVDGIEFLVKKGVNVNMQDRITRRTALHFVGLTGYVPLARLLLKWGVDVMTPDVLGKTAAEIAKQHSNDEVYELLMCLSDFNFGGSVSTVSMMTGKSKDF